MYKPVYVPFAVTLILGVVAQIRELSRSLVI